MKNIFIPIFIIAIQAINTPVMANNEALQLDSKLNLELAEIRQKRLSTEATFKTQEAACYKKFAVSTCLQELKSEKSLSLSDLKRRELAINDQKRQIKADALEKKTNEKSKKIIANEQTKEQSKAQTASPNPSNKRAARSEKSSVSKTNRVASAPKDQDKLAEQRALTAHQRVLESSKKQAISQRKAHARAKKLSQTQTQETQFNKKLLAAQKHKSDVEKTVSEKTKSKSAPLPVPATLQIKP